MEDLIEEIGIDQQEWLYLKPATETFPMIYREAMEVHWNSEHKYLYGAKPRKWGYIEWYQQIIKAAAEQGCKLVFSPSVSWVNVPSELQAQITGEHSAKNT
ncbi:hypothetical protein [Shewanella japonica]|uniref:Integron Cassette Protein Hfx-Cass5 domain-containing protein n=1 Tax=Shewanella japonica TaxID=93973 RepID=A0ABN4YFK5_9GAMM|nr:hypothetical protein [Shewanella japonica]ARD22978.1 hypothetical protein SJ2017_2691 [Shewanella japonica]